MRIAFYAPLKSPNHPVPSGDRLMARLLSRRFERAGHEVEIASELRSYSASSALGAHDEAAKAAEAEIARLAAQWSSGRAPDLWFCYHPYSKAPDLIGPRLSQLFGLAYVTAEASYSERRNIGAWVESQALVAAGRPPGRGQHLPQAKGPRRADDDRAVGPLRDARTVHRRRRLPRYQARARVPAASSPSP